MGTARAFSMTRSASIPGSIALLLSLPLGACIPTTSAFGEDYLPLAFGNTWVYDSAYFAEHEALVITGTTDLWGQQVFVLDVEESTHNEDLRQFWTSTSDGQVYLWGFVMVSDGYGILYRPPLHFVNGPLYLDKTWHTESDILSLPDTTWVGTLSADLRVYEYGPLTLPIGKLTAYGIGFAAFHASMEFLPPNRDFAGNFVSYEPTPGANATRWWTEEVGIVQYSTSDLYQLSRIDSHTLVRSESWGSIKILLIRP